VMSETNSDVVPLDAQTKNLSMSGA
jgi:hypothetical protein